MEAEEDEDLGVVGAAVNAQPYAPRGLNLHNDGLKELTPRSVVVTYLPVD